MITPEMLAANPSESSQQKALMCWSALNIKRYPELKWLTAIPSGGQRDAIAGGRMKAEGLKRGLPDLMLFFRKNAWAGLAIEMKVGKNKTFQEQNEWLAHLQSQGYDTAVCRSYEEARDRIIKYLES